MLRFLAIVLLVVQALAESHPWIAEHKDQHWMERHEKLLNQTKQHGKEAQIVFIGDSITEGWLGNGKAVWNKYYAPRHAFNYGIGGDRTENVLWRIENKEFDGIKPKVAVLMIGINNVHYNTIEDIAQGIHTILKQLAVKMPETKVLLLALLPRSGPIGGRAKQLNVLIKKFADDKTVHWLDMWSAFESADGQQKTELYVADHLHLNPSGYEVWHKTMDSTLNKLIPAH